MSNKNSKVLEQKGDLLSFKVNILPNHLLVEPWYYHSDGSTSVATVVPQQWQ